MSWGVLRTTIMGQAVVQVDAFTSQPFAGNPAAVCVLSRPADPGWMQAVAHEMNLSETAFAHPLDGEAVYQLRWFTPAVEVDLCGHATLAAAHVLWEGRYLERTDPALFHTRSGLLTAVRQGDWIELDFPAEPAAAEPAPAALLEALKAPVRFTGRNRFDWLVELESEEALRRLAPDITRLATVPTRGVIVTSRARATAAGSGYDFVSRFFAPRLGVPEDPVCGSAHCCLAPYWCERLGKAELVGYQASARGGYVRVRPDGDRVFLAGQAVTVMRGELVTA
jgi:PhzF family phenazine biosynthesis protein